MMDNLFNISIWLDQIEQHFPGILLVVQHVICCYDAMYLGKKLRSRGFGVSRYIAAPFAIICYYIITMLICIDVTEEPSDPRRVNLAWTMGCVFMLPFCYVLAQLLDHINASNYLAITVNVASFALWIARPTALEKYTFTIRMIDMAGFHAPLVISMLGGQVLAQYGRIALQYCIPFLVIIGLHPGHGIWGLMLRYMPARSHFGQMVYLATAMVVGVILHINSAPEVIAQQPTDQPAQPLVTDLLLPQDEQITSDQHTGGYPPRTIIRTPSSEAEHYTGDKTPSSGSNSRTAAEQQDEQSSGDESVWLRLL